MRRTRRNDLALGTSVADYRGRVVGETEPFDATRRAHKLREITAYAWANPDDIRSCAYGYCKEALIEVNLVFSLVPSPFTVAMMASAMPAAIRPYSIAVAAFSSAQNFRTNVIMRDACLNL
jgi:hypothetical protein